MLEIKNLKVKKEEKEILKGIDLEIKNNDGVVVFGPNGGGKSTLFKAIIGIGELETNGKISLDGSDLLKMNVEERVKEGIGYMYQTAPVVKGVELNSLINSVLKLESSSEEIYSQVKEKLEDLDMEYLFDRDINVGLSGGEVKRSELFTLSLLENIKLYLFDEPDSGVDMENVQRIGKYIANMVESSAYMIVTHSGEILKYLKPEKGIVVMNGKIVYEGDPMEILEEIQKNGYSKYGKEEN
jgi:Fe-S cluster assembly ATP-binding protein